MTPTKMVQAARPFQIEVLPEGDRLFQWVEEIAELERYARGAWIQSGHDVPDAIYLIRRGQVGVSAGEAGVVLGSGELFGEIFFDDCDVRGSYLARALSESEVWVVRRRRVEELLGGKGQGALWGLIGYKQELLFLFRR